MSATDPHPLTREALHKEVETTQIYAAAVSERRRATVMGMEFGRIDGAGGLAAVVTRDR